MKENIRAMSTTEPWVCLKGFPKIADVSRQDLFLIWTKIICYIGTMGLIYYGDFCCRDEYFYNCPHKLPPLVCCPGRGRSSRGELRFLHCLRSPIKLLRHLVPQTVLTARAVQIPSQMGMGLWKRGLWFLLWSVHGIYLGQGQQLGEGK